MNDRNFLQPEHWVTEEIRAAMNVTETNLGVILHRARLQLRQCLERHWFLHGKDQLFTPRTDSLLIVRMVYCMELCR